jgi:hypothetical protein
MNTITIKKLSLPKLAPRNSFKKDLPRIKRITIRIVICIIIFYSILFLHIYEKFFSPISLIESASIKLFYAPLLGKVYYKESIQAGLGLQTKDLMILLTKQKFVPVVFSTIKKSEFTVSGNIILIDNDNIAVFEYDNIDTAKAEVTLYVNKYGKNVKPYTWKESTHIFTKDNLIIFYLGSKEKITNFLTEFAGKSLM